MSKLATFAGGCFWGIEHYFKKEFGSCIKQIKVGYTGGNIESPTYKQICTGNTGHAEAVQLLYDDSKASYEDLVTYFWRIHDPTSLNRQGNDIGTQYRSSVFFHDEEQKEIALKVKEIIKGKYKGEITTEIIPAQTFYVAEDYHQAYLENNPGGYCNHGLKW